MSNKIHVNSIYESSVNVGDGIGIIYGTVGTSSFDCCLTYPVQKNDYVQVWHESYGWILGQIEKLERRTNLSIEKANQVYNGEDVEIEERIIGSVAVIGYRDKRGLLQTPRFPFKAGTRVYHASEELIKEVLGLKENMNGAYIGKLVGHDIKVRLDINSLVQKHMSILAKTGGGKSYVAGVLIEELIKQGVTVLILDPHGEYTSLRKKGRKSDKNFDVEPRSYASFIEEFSPDTRVNRNAKPLRFTLSNLTARDLLSLTNIKNVRTYLPPLRKALDILHTSKPHYTIKDIIKVLTADESGEYGTLITELEYLDEINIFASQGTRIDEVVREGKTTIINFRGTPPDIQELIVNRICTALFELRKIGKIPAMMLVVEEAHNFCPQQGLAASSKILRTIASEGRKFGLGLTIITQRAAKVDKNVLSQCNTQIILKVTNPNDLKAIVSSVEGLTSAAADEIQRLPTGVAVVTAPNLSMPLYVEVRPRETLHGGESVKVVSG